MAMARMTESSNVPASMAWTDDCHAIARSLVAVLLDVDSVASMTRTMPSLTISYPGWAGSPRSAWMRVLFVIVMLLSLVDVGHWQIERRSILKH
jgi:hypothetical protein